MKKTVSNFFAFSCIIFAKITEKNWKDIKFGSEKRILKIFKIILEIK